LAPRLSGAAGFPTLFSTALGVFGLVAGPSRFPLFPGAPGFRVRLFSSLGLVVAPPAREPAQDTSASSFPRVLTFSTRSATASGSALAQRHGSRLLPLRSLFLTGQRHPFAASPTRGRFSQASPLTCVLPGAHGPLCPAFQRLCFG
jgi:hypothetical protein